MKFALALAALLALAPAVQASVPAPCLPPPPSCDDCVPCEGAITDLTLLHRSAGPVLVIAYQGAGADRTAVFCNEVPPCEPFDIYDGHWRLDHLLGADLELFINDHYVTTIPMMCDPRVAPGAEFGPFTIVAGRSQAGPLCPLSCEPPPPPPPPPGPCSECEGKVTTLTLAYRGPAAAQIRVDMKKDGGTIFDNVVAPGGSFVIQGNDKNGTLGTEIKLYVDGLLHAAIHTSCSQPIGAGLVAGDFLVVDGASLKGGRLCPLDTPPGNPPSDGCDCDGKVKSLALRYLGDAPAFIQVQQKDGQLVFADDVAPGNLITFFGMDKNGTLGTEIRFSVDGEADVAIHTSCSKPIGPGLVVGRFEVVVGESLKGGALCPVAPDAQGDGSSSKGSKDAQKAQKELEEKLEKERKKLEKERKDAEKRAKKSQD